MNKSSLREGILQQLRAELQRQADAAQLARDEAISEESRAENKWDTHSQEAAYLAEGQARIAADIRASIELYSTLPLPNFAAGDPIQLGAVVAIETAGQDMWYLIGPRAGGMEIESEGRRLLVVTPQSPLGRQLVGRTVGDTVQVGGRAGASLQRIRAIE